ncbi:hypothetical protein PRIPAC_96435 [Pristionchus pacificus]|uniref:Uncharacterized protein n=1 Tax=Pristionchus pacificus TaxID=54126 RepID=A0A2A6BXP6_PRIPA|nr:hypothetical protein PRIPAC_96435 [Pristionchus pacificus]|eukprot:PDM70675.1 hypothetical protein PRIPAC_43880 [Pristionchus pacificus]
MPDYEPLDDEVDMIPWPTLIDLWNGFCMYCSRALAVLQLIFGTALIVIFSSGFHRAIGDSFWLSHPGLCSLRLRWTRSWKRKTHSHRKHLPYNNVLSEKHIFYHAMTGWFMALTFAFHTKTAMIITSDEEEYELEM